MKIFQLAFIACLASGIAAPTYALADDDSKEEAATETKDASSGGPSGDIIGNELPGFHNSVPPVPDPLERNCNTLDKNAAEAMGCFNLK